MNQTAPPQPAARDRIEAGPTPRALAVGIAMMIATTMLFTALDTSAKFLSASLPTTQIVWVRFISHTLILTAAILLLNGGRIPMRSRSWGLQIARSFTMAMTTVLNFLALRTMQLAETNAIFFTAPMFVVMLAGPLLGEWAGPRRWAAVLIGFLGVLVIVQPGTSEIGWPVVYVLGASAIYALYNILTRKLAGRDDPRLIFAMTPVAGTLIFAPFALADWTAPPDLLHWAILIAMGILGGLGHGTLLLALSRAPAPILAPFIYVQLIWMSLAGFLVFGDIPTTATFVGAAIVVASGIYVWFREQRIAKRQEQTQ